MLENKTEEKRLLDQTVEATLRMISSWGPLMTIIIHQGHIFEFKGNFPDGSIAEGYYNLQPGQGFTGHIRLEKLIKTVMVCGQHRGRDSYHLRFMGQNDRIVFKVFLGRDANGEIFATQLEQFMHLFNLAKPIV